MQNKPEGQADLTELVNELAQLNFQQSLAIKQLRLRSDSQKALFLKQFEDFRSDAEHKILSMQRTYAASLMNVIKSRMTPMSMSDTESLSIQEHKIEVN